MISRRKLLRPHVRPRRKTQAARIRHRSARTGRPPRQALLRDQSHRSVVPPRPDVAPAQPGRASVRPWLFLIVLGVAVAGAAWIELSPVFFQDPSLPLLGVGDMVDDADSPAGLQRKRRYLNMVIPTRFTLTHTPRALWGRQ